MLGLQRRMSRRRDCLRIRLLLALLSLLLVTDIVVAQKNVTLDDTDLYIMYSPAKAWHANTVECDSCLAPPTSDAQGGTWHDGTHIVPTTDEDDEPTDGDPDGDSSSSAASSSALASSTSSISSSSSSTSPPPSTSSSTKASSTTSAPSAQTSSDDDDDDDDGKKGGKGGGGKRRRVRSLRNRRLAPGFKRDGTDPFETNSTDADDPGFTDVPVTAAINFTGEAIYLYSIIPLFPAPANTTPTFTNLTFTLDGQSHGGFKFQPDPTQPGTPNVNSSASDKFEPNVNVFSAAGLSDGPHSLVVDVAVDSVFLLDYVVITISSSDPVPPGASATPDGQRTTGSSTANPTSSHDVATFAGAVGGSVGFLSVLALWLCISIQFRRRRARQRDQRIHAPFAESFTARDHGEDGPDDENSTLGRARVQGQPAMAQAAPAPFVPRYFPGSLPASPPPYVAEPEGPTIVTPTSPIGSIGMSMTRAGFPVAVPSTLPPIIAMPTATLDLQRTASNNTSHSYAERPPPTPPDEDTQISMFGTNSMREIRNLNGGIIGPLPVDSPTAEETDPMLGVNLDDDDEDLGRLPVRTMRQMNHTFDSSAGSRSSGSSEPSETVMSSTYPTSSQPTSSASSITDSSTPSTPKRAEPNILSQYPTLSNSTSLPSLTAPQSSRLLASPSSPNLAPKPTFLGSLSPIAYPLLQPSRVPLPASEYSSVNGSHDTLARHDSRT